MIFEDSNICSYDRIVVVFILDQIYKEKYQGGDRTESLFGLASEFAGSCFSSV